MAMNLSPGGDGEGDDDAPIMDINTTPLIDVMLVLLVMLIITIPIQLHNVTLDMPVGKTPPLLVKPEVVRIDIDADSRLYWQGRPLADRAELEALLSQAAAQPVTPEIHVRPDKAARYERFVEVIVSARHRGLTKLGVLGGEQFIQP